jgi:hypothetical protein
MVRGFDGRESSMLYTWLRKRIDSNKLYGAVVAESESLIMIHQEVEFQFDGYLVLRQKDISCAYTSETNAYFKSLMKKEGLWKTPTKFARSLPLDDWRSLLQALVGTVVAVENERLEEFYIGPVVECDERAVAVHHFDSCGDWQQIQRIPYRQITCVQIGNRYINVHSRHLRPRPVK